MCSQQEADWLGFLGRLRAGEIEFQPEEMVEAAMLSLCDHPLQGRGRYNVHYQTQAAELLQERSKQYRLHADIKTFDDDDYEVMIAGLVVIPAWSTALGDWVRGRRSV